MLIEAPPYYLLNGVSIFRDHEDARQFYYQPLGPRFVTRRDGAVEVPQLSLLEFRSATLNGGLLDFDVHLGLNEQEFAAVRQGVANLAGLAELPFLNPVPVVDGSVNLMLFGAQSGGAPTAFVRAIRHGAKPSLYGDNRAAFSVELDERGVTLLKQAMNLELSPIGIVYSLDYLALRPAYHVHLEIDWDRTQDIMDTEYGHEGLFTDIQIQDTVEKLEDERAIVFNTDTFVPEDDTSTVVERRDAAVARARDMITDAFFFSSIDPLREAPDGWDKAAEVIKSFSPRRASPLGVFSYRNEHVSRTDRKRLDVDFSERTTAKRTIYPQGHLAGLFRLLGPGFDPSRLITQVDVDDPWFRRRRLTVISRADFQADPVRSMNATMTYNGVTETVRLDKDRDRDEVEWPSQLAGGQILLPIDLTFAVNLVPAEAGERPNQLRSASTSVLGEEHEIQPRDLFSEEPIPILTLEKFPFARYPRVDVQLKYDDPANGIRQDDVIRLTAQKPSAEWKRFLVGPPAAPIMVKITYRAADGSQRQGAFTVLDAPQVDVPDPFPTRLVVRIVEALGPGVERAFVDLTFLDPDNGQQVDGSIEVLPDQPVEPFVVNREDPTATLVRYQITLLMKDSTLIELPRSSTRGSRIFVREDLRGHRTVLVRSPADFAAAGLERIEVEARASDEQAALVFEDRFDFTAAGASALFEFDFVDPARDAFELRVKRLFRNGLSSTRDWTRFDTDTVSIAATT